MESTAAIQKHARFETMSKPIVIKINLPDEFFKAMRELLDLPEPTEEDAQQAPAKDKSASEASTVD